MEAQTEVAGDKAANVKKPKTESIQTTTLAELGPQLPIGTHDPAGGGLLKEMAHRRWSLKLEKELGKLRSQNRRANVGKFVSIVLTTLYERLGALSLAGGAQPNNLNQHVSQLGQMWAADALYAWIWLRGQVLGPELTLELTCPACVDAKTVKADLGSLEVRIAHRLEATRWVYDLAEPLTIRGAKVERLQMGPPRWDTFVKMKSADQDTGGQKAEVIFASIQGVVGQENIALAPHEIDELGKLDIERITASIEANHFGPNMMVETKCPDCQREIRAPIDWRYDSFFGVSGP